MAGARTRNPCLDITLVVSWLGLGNSPKSSQQAHRMTRRIVRTVIQLGTLAIFGLIVLVFVDNRFRVLPSSIHDYLPLHHADLVITDIRVTKCSSINPLSSCSLGDESWHRIEKDLYLGSAWFSRAYVDIQRKKESELLTDDRVILDVTISRLDPSTGEKGSANEQWEARSQGVWIKRSAGRPSADSVTGVDVLFGADAVDPREGWEIKDTSILLDGLGEAHQARLSIRRGKKVDPVKPVPRIGDNGKFKILQVADLHLSTGLGECRDAIPDGYHGGKCEADPRTLEFIGRILDEENPDLVVLTGDQVNGETAPDAQSAIFKFAELFITRKIPYATIFGNHDSEGSLSRAAQMALLETLPYSLSEAGPEHVDGVGNYVVEILARGSSKHSALSLYLLDTHSYSPDEKTYPGYDWLKKSQIDWFRKTAADLKELHDQYTHHHMDLAFIHIPLPEYRDKKENVIVGSWNETVMAPGFNSGFKDALVEQGVLVVSCGHDHVNDYCSLSKDGSQDPKLWMCYGGGAGLGGYGGHGGYTRRVRLFSIDVNESRITTYKRLEHGDTDRKIDEQIIVEGGTIRAPDS